MTVLCLVTVIGHEPSTPKVYSTSAGPLPDTTLMVDRKNLRNDAHDRAPKKRTRYPRRNVSPLLMAEMFPHIAMPQEYNLSISTEK
jgi:hypothetical protein